MAVLSGVDLDPSLPRRHDGAVGNTLWGELGLQRGGAEAFAHVRSQDELRQAPGRDALTPALGEGPVLILMDEVMQYIQRAGAISVGGGTLAQQALTFVQTLTETVRSRPGTALVYSLQASVQEAAGDETSLRMLEHLVGRMEAVREPVSGDEVMRVVQRRLFSDLGDPAERERVAAAYAHAHEAVRLATATGEDERRRAAQEAQELEARVADSYPFHPALLDCMYHRWGSLPSYQRTRGALQFLARVVHALYRSDDPASVPPLIGPGDVPLHDGETRGAFFSQVGGRAEWTAPMAADITGPTANAREVDRRIGADAPQLEQLRVGTRVATAIMLHSHGARQDAERGIREPELMASVAAPELDHGVLQRALSELRNELLYLHSIGRLYRFEVRPNLNKLIADHRVQWRGEEVDERVREEVGRAVGDRDAAIVWPPDPSAVPDHEPRFRIVYLDPRSAEWGGESIVAERLTEWLERRAGVTRDYRNALAFALMDPGAPNRVREAARTVMTLEDMAANAVSHGLSPEQREEVREKTRAAKADLARAVEGLYTRVAIPIAGGDGPHGYGWRPLRTEGRQLSGSGVHEKLMSLLRDHVFDTVTPAKLAQLVKLSDEEGGRRHYPCDRLVRDAFSIFEFPKVVDAGVVRHAVARGVEEGVFAYVPMARQEGDSLHAERPDLVAVRRPIAADELDLGEGTFICTPGLARELAPPSPEDEPALDPVGPGPAPEPAPPPAPPPTGATRSIVVRFEANPSQLMRVIPGLTNLAERSADIRFEVTVRATASSQDGYDRAFLTNAVEEHFLEADVPWRPEDGAR